MTGDGARRREAARDARLPREADPAARRARARGRRRGPRRRASRGRARRRDPRRALFSMIVRLADSLDWDVPPARGVPRARRRDPARRVRARGLKQRDRLRGEPLAAAGEFELVRRRRAHRDASQVHLERSGEQAPASACAPADLRLLADQHDVGVHELVATRAHLRVRLAEELERRDALQLGILRGEQGADVAKSCRRRGARRSARA